MKKTIVSIICLMLIITMTSCVKKNTDENPSDDYQKQQNAEIIENDNPSDAEEKKVEITGDFTISSGNDGGYTYENGIATIFSGGEYTLKGNLGGGRVVVNAPDEKVTLVLDETSITNGNDAPISILDAKKISIRVNDGTYNEINDERSKKAETTGTTEEEDSTDNAAIWATCDLTIEGTGALVVTGNYYNGIQTKDKLTISTCNLKVTAYKHGLKGNDEVSVNSGEIVIKTNYGDGIKTSNSSLSEKGNQKGSISITGGNVLVESYGDGINSAYDVNVSGDSIVTVKTGKYAGFTTSTSSKSSSGGSRPGGSWGFGGNTTSSKTSYSTKGIKADNQISIDGGKIQISSNDDGIHVNKGTLESGSTGIASIVINGGEIQIAASDDGIHSEDTLTINNGTIVVTESYEGLEAETMIINDGYVDIYASDDGLNAFGGSGMGNFGGRGGGPGGSRGGSAGGSQSGSTTNPSITVNGGCVIVETPSGDTDAIDSNGNFTQTGGFLLVKGGSSSGNVAGSIDVDGVITVTGGTCVALGGICELPTSGSCNYVRFQRKSFANGDYTITDSSGNVICEFTLESTFSSAWICSNAFQKNETYTIKKDGSSFTSWKQSSSSVTG